MHRFQLISLGEIDEKARAEVLKSLSAPDRERMERMRGLRRDNFVAGRWLLLSDGVDISRIRYINRKPMVDEVYFSISHEDTLTVATTDAAPIGIDIERIKPVSDSIKRSFNMPAEMLDEDFIEWFTRKEAYIKLRGLGMNHMADDVSVYKFETERLGDYLITICQA